ncbi:anti-sigma-I factor RsgI family protein [Virgibacillus sp. DJP39]|uniref:anti-sigma-I factor RsgI family protein n=1 Tax=Virgibacillus sp. DJP39 TaxID=3409790 RepID=UPI003BB65601
MKKHTIEGVVTKVTENEYVLLCDDGTFKNIRRTEHDVPMMGERMMCSAKTQPLPFKFVSTIAMVAILFIAFLSYGVLQNHSETHYIAATDINPSIEAHLDQDLNVIKLLALNTDGKQIVNSIELEGLDFYQVVNLIISESISKGFLTTEEKGRIETTIVKVTSDSDALSERDLTEVIQTQLQRQNIVADVLVFNEPKEFYDQAKRADVSMNKYRHFQSLREKGLVQNIHEVKEKSVKQLQDMIEEDVKKVPDEVEQGDSTEENAKLNSESRQNPPQTPKDQKGNQTEKLNLDDKQERSANKGAQQQDRNTKTSKDSPSPENEAHSNPNPTEDKSSRAENESSRDEELNQKPETEGNQTTSNDNNPETKRN